MMYIPYHLRCGILLCLFVFCIINKPFVLLAADVNNGDIPDEKQGDTVAPPAAPVKDDKKEEKIEKIEKKAAAKDAKKIRPERNVFTIGEIVVKSESIAHIDQAATTTELTDKDLKARGNRTLDEAMSTVPGVLVEAHQKGIMRVKIRGFDQDKIAILQDGMPIADVYSTDIDISDISVKNISRIYVNRGVSSALYGSSGAIGAINIVSKKPEKLFAQGGAEYGMYNNYTFDAAVGGPFKNFYGWITGSMQNSDGYHPSRNLDNKTKLHWYNKLIRYYVYGVNPVDMNIPGPYDYFLDTGMWNHSSYRRYNTSGRIGYEYNDLVDVGVSARFNYGTSKTNTYQPRACGDYHIENLSWNEPIYEFSIGKQLKKAGLVNRSFYWPEKYGFTVSPYAKVKYKFFSMKVQGFYSQNYSKQEGYLDNAHIYPKDAAAVTDKDDSFYQPFYDYKTYESYGVQAYPSFRIASWNRLSLAALWRTDELYGQQQAKSWAMSQDIAILYGMSKYKVNYLKASFVTVAIEDEVSIKDRLKLTAGVSYDAQDFMIHKARFADFNYIYGDQYIVRSRSTLWGTRDSFNPVAGLVVDAVEDLLTLKSAFSMKTRFPTLSEYEKVSNRLYDRSLKPERSYNFNCGPRFYFFEKELEFGADYFYSIIKNRIEKVAGGEEPPINISRIDAQGVETSISYKKKKIARVMEINASLYYTYLDMRNLDTSWDETANKGKLMENTPAHQVIADLRFNFVSGTSFGIWGTALINQVMYAQKSRPITGPPSAYWQKYFEAVRLHDNFNLNIKVSQVIWSHFTLYVLFKNILDDYNPDPFNPGPGFMCYGGFEAKL